MARHVLDNVITTVLEAVALLAIAVGVGVAVAGTGRLGLAVVASGVVLIGSTTALGWLAARTAGGEDEPV